MSEFILSDRQSDSVKGRFTSKQIAMLGSLADWRLAFDFKEESVFVEIRAIVFKWEPVFKFEVVDFHDLCLKLDELVWRFDVDTETYKLLGPDGHGRNGVAFSMLQAHHEVEILYKWLEALCDLCKAFDR